MTDTKFHLYRSCRKRDWGNRKTSDDLRSQKFLSVDGKTSLHPNYGFIRKDGSVRPSDVTLFNKGGEKWVRGVDDMKSDGKHWVSWKEGVSISKNKEVMPYSGGGGSTFCCRRAHQFLHHSMLNIPRAIQIQITTQYALRIKCSKKPIKVHWIILREMRPQRP